MGVSLMRKFLGFALEDMRRELCGLGAVAHMLQSHLPWPQALILKSCSSLLSFPCKLLKIP